MNTPSERILMMERSLRCYAMGWFSLVPPLGIVLFPLAVLDYQRTRISASEAWNPGSFYLNWGVILAATGGFLSLVAAALAIAWWINAQAE